MDDEAASSLYKIRFGLELHAVSCKYSATGHPRYADRYWIR